eukprot:s4839_g2.t1
MACGKPMCKQGRPPAVLFVALAWDLKLKYEKKQDQVIQAARKRTEEARQDFEESNAKVRAMESAERASWVKKVQQDAEKAWRRRVLDRSFKPPQ